MATKTIAGFIYGKGSPCGFQKLSAARWKEMRAENKAAKGTEARVNGDILVKDRKGAVLFEIYKETKS